jgi:hypothetical protein
MDKKSLLSGMALGGAIAFGGMILGGQGAANQPAKPVPAPAPGTPWVDEFKAKAIYAEDFYIVNPAGQKLVSIRQNVNLGSIQIYDDRNQELVRIAGVLRGGGNISTFEDGRPLVEIGSIGQGGKVEVTAKDGGASTLLAAVGAGGVVITKDGEGKLTSVTPESMRNENAPAAPAPSAKPAAGGEKPK